MSSEKKLVLNCAVKNKKFMDTPHCWSPWRLVHNTKNRAKRLMRSIITLVSTPKPTIPTEIMVEILKPTIPTEIMVEILSRLDAQTLLKLKSMSNQLRALIEDPNFAQEHASRARDQWHYHDEEAEDTFKVVSFYSGLIVERKSCNDSKEEKYRVRNPTIRQVFDIPDPHENTTSITISYAPSSCCYKLISVYVGKDKTKIVGTEVLALGCVDEPSWRALDVTLLRNLRDRDGPLSVYGFKGVVHFCPKKWIGSKDFEIVSLDMDKECFRSIMLPRSFFPGSRTNFRIIGYYNHQNQSCLSAAEIAKDEVRILVLEDYKKGKWAEEKITIPLTFLKENSHLESAQLFWASPWYVYFMMNEETINYSIKSQQLIKNESPPPGKKNAFIAKYTLETFKGMRSEGN